MLEAITAIGISLASHHLMATKDYNEVNPGVFVESSEWVAGVYKNSFSKTTVLVARRFPLNEHFGVTAGVCTGYRVPVCAAAYARMGPVELMIAPPSGSNKGVIGLVLRIPLK